MPQLSPASVCLRWLPTAARLLYAALRKRVAAPVSDVQAGAVSGGLVRSRFAGRQSSEMQLGGSGFLFATEPCETTVRAKKQTATLQ